jgi:ATP diphosphatase
MRAHKLSKRAARVGFDFVTAGDAADKVAEELTEIRALLAANATPAPPAHPSPPAQTAPPAQPGPSARVIEELGDLLFAATNLARKLEVDAEAALRAANAKFERRFRGMEALAAERGTPFESLGLVAQERLWQEMKRSE